MAGKIYSYAERLGIGRGGRKRLSYDRFGRPVQIPINYTYRAGRGGSGGGRFDPETITAISRDYLLMYSNTLFAF